MRKEFLPFARPDLGKEEIASVSEVLESGWIVSGPKNFQLENAIKELTGCKYAVAVNSGTSGLYLAVKALGLSEGEVITPSLSFIATSNIILENGLTPRFVDINRKTLNINASKVKPGKESRAIIPVHFNGLVCDMDKLQELGEAGIPIIEDAAHAIGAEHNGKKIGNISDMTVFSFHPNKNVTSGEGGVVTTNNKEYADKIRSLRYFGFTPITEKDRTRYEQTMNSLSLKYNMPDIQAAIALEQLKKLKDFTAKRLKLVKIYEDLLSESFCKKHGVVKIEQALESKGHVHHMYQIFVEQRETVMTKMNKQNIGVGVHYTPIHQQPYYQSNKCWKASGLKETEWVGERTLTLPLFTKMV
ncbi:MAG: DegT/DnrJ/EryC1/StrS aminotransferase family protein, partial [Candidatus Woesearchaeota archaeon]|nr:DegT/DnrJ/EryC1/StrS aminotransferase family protein [Candidatus Woesearchaeota archaeon]